MYMGKSFSGSRRKASTGAGPPPAMGFLPNDAYYAAGHERVHITGQPRYGKTAFEVR